MAITSRDELDSTARAAAILSRNLDRATAPAGCWPWTKAVDKDGYGRTVVCVQRRRVRIHAHRLAFLLHYGYLPAPPLVVRHHICGNPRCCNPAHLAAGTVQDNIDDTERMGRTARGERTGHYTHPERLLRGEDHWTHRRPERVARGAAQGGAKLDDETVLEIRRLDADGMSEVAIATRFGIAPSTVHRIVSGRGWKHVPVQGERPRGILRGEAHWNAQLTTEQVREIRSLAATGLSHAAIGCTVGCSRHTVRDIVRGKIWRHVP